MEKYFNSIAPWQELLSCDFNRGYMCGVLLVLAVVLILLVLRIVLGILFRPRRTRSIVIPAPDGDMQISQDAVASVIDCMMADFPEIMLDSLKIYRRGKKYSLHIQCRFTPGERTFPDVVSTLKEKIFNGLENQFGITGLHRIRIALKSLEGHPLLNHEDAAGQSDTSVPPVLPGNNTL